MILQTTEHKRTTGSTSHPPRHISHRETRQPPAQHTTHLASEAVEGAALALEGVDDVHGGDGLAAGVLGVGDGVADDVLEEDLEDAAGLLVDEAGDALHAAPPRQPPDRRLGDALDVVAEDCRLAPPFPSPLPPLPRPQTWPLLSEIV
uniref:Uncharacterized protein n=1 Tax=Aegilops tauschii subsp. strangulata TaxID=200361 RepID=A0A453CQ49_AEGTS